MKTPTEIIKAWHEDGDLDLQPGSVHVITQLMREYADQFRSSWHLMDRLTEEDHGKDLLLIACDEMPLRADGGVLHLGKYRHDMQEINTGNINWPIKRFKLFMLTDSLLP